MGEALTKAMKGGPDCLRLWRSKVSVFVPVQRLAVRRSGQNRCRAVFWGFEELIRCGMDLCCEVVRRA